MDKQATLAHAEKLDAPARTWEFTVMRDPRGWPPSPNDRLHWRARNLRNQYWREAVWAETKRLAIPALDRVRVDVVFHTYAGPRMDLDNMVARTKPIVDGLVGCYARVRGGPPLFMVGIVYDDSARYVRRGTVGEVRDATVSSARVVVTITDLSRAGVPERNETREEQWSPRSEPTTRPN